MEKKNIFKLIVVMRSVAIIAFVAVIGFSFIACDDSGGGGSNINASVGNNAVGGRTYYRSSSKIEFAESAGANGTYTGYGARNEYNNDGDYDEYDLDADGKYQWDINETGTYTWNEDAKTVTLKPGKLSGPDGNLLDRAKYKTAYTAEINRYIAAQKEYLKEHYGWTQAQVDAYIKKQLADMGYSSITQYINAMVDEAFSNHPYTYSFSADGDSLFMQKTLPQPKGTDELAGKTYNGMTWDTENDVLVKDPDTEYVFSSNKTYTYTRDYGFSYSETITGFYSYDSTQKRVYFNIATINGKTAAEYYETVTIYGDNHFINDDDYKAAQTNVEFSYYDPYNKYDPIQLIIGWFD
jgi:hypothetical protein